ncbi:MAG: flippase-like domain-containing protein [Sphingomonadales bacterium]|nr:flippase-like domain-containing protein [Sphingomonadales bacterium]
MKKLLSLTILVVLLGWAVWYVAGHADEFGAVAQVTVPVLLGLIAVMLVYLCSQAVILYLVVRRYGTKIGLSESFGLLMVTLFTNYVFPFAGIGVRAAYLKKVHFLPLGAFAAGLAATILIELMVYAIGGLVGLWLLRTTVYFDLPLILLLLGIIGATVACFLSPRLAWHPRGEISAKIMRALAGWQEFAGDRRAVLQVAALTVIQFAAFAGCFWLAISVVAPVTTAGVLLSASLTDFAFFIRIAPAAVGSFEAAIAYAGQLQGFSFADALIIAALLRGTMMAWFMLLGPFFFFRLLRKNQIL